MGSTAQPSPIIRKLFTVAMLATLLVLFAALYVRFTQEHRPEWGDYAYAGALAMIGLQHLLFPDPGRSSRARYWIATAFFAMSASFLLLTISE